MWYNIREIPYNYFLLYYYNTNMNNTHSGCPNDIGKRHFTDYRPSKSLYTDVKNNAEFRKYMQSNGAKIIASLQDLATKENKCCACENTKFVSDACSGKVTNMLAGPSADDNTTDYKSK